MRKAIWKASLICDRCGYKLPVYLPEAVIEDELEPSVACAQCGVKGLPGRLCLTCGAVIRVPEP